MIVYSGKTHKGVDVVVRYPKISDLDRFYKYANLLAKEKRFSLFHGEKMSIEEEKDWLLKITDEIKKCQAVYLVAIAEDEIAGFGGIKLRSKAQSHIGDLEVSVEKGFRGIGVGSLLSSMIITEAEKGLKKLRIIVATTFEANTLAKKMYKKLGFKKFGCLPGGVHHKARYIGLLYLYREII